MMHRRWAWWCGAATLALGGGVAIVAQDSGVPDGAGNRSLAALTSEMRQLREAVQELSRRQVQAQALASYMSVQHARLSQAGSRLDGVRRELESLTVRGRELASQLASVHEALAREIDPARRTEMEDARRNVRLEQSAVAFREQQARDREIELAQSLQQEEARWTDLTARMEQLVISR